MSWLLGPLLKSQRRFAESRGVNCDWRTPWPRAVGGKRSTGWGGCFASDVVFFWVLKATELFKALLGTRFRPEKPKSLGVGWFFHDSGEGPPKWRYTKDEE